jgi:hypothetical protein
MTATGERERRWPIGPILVVAVFAVFAVLAVSVAVVLVGRLPACQFVSANQCTRVLFIGNSYTSVNDLPAMVARLAASGGRHVETGMVAPGGAFLADEAANPDVTATINGTTWTAVVLQEQSQRPASATEVTASFVPAVIKLVSTVRAAGARPYLLETWAHREGWPELGLTYTSMQAALDQGYATAAQATSAQVIPAGEAWQRAWGASLPVALWQDDGSHPSVAGTYLAACTVYEALFNASPVGLSDHEGLPDDVAAQLQRLAAGG